MISVTALNRIETGYEKAMKKFIITGSPHSGKTKVLQELERHGIAVLHETARLIIREDQEKMAADPSFNVKYPWDDQAIFCRRCHERQLEREKNLTGDLIVMDRSIIDNLAYAKVAGIKLDKKIYRDIERAGYEKKVFFMERLKNYKTDDQRKDSKEQVKAIHDELYKIYSDLGFKIIDIPLFSDDKDTNIIKRAEAVLRHLGKEGTPLQ